MIVLFYLLLFTLTCAHKCSFQTPIAYEQIYLCRETLNASSIRIWLHVKWNQNSRYDLHFFSFYVFTLRIIDSIDENHIRMEDRFEKAISDHAQINLRRRENHTINIHNLPSGRYEICVNFFSKNSTKFYYRSVNSCLHVPWNVSEFQKEQINLFFHVLFLALIIILLVAIAFFIYALHQCFTSQKPLPPPSAEPGVAEDTDNEENVNERARLLVNQHFVRDVRPLESMVRKRIHQRYAH